MNFLLLLSMALPALTIRSCGFRGGPECQRAGESCAEVQCDRRLVCNPTTMICQKGLSTGQPCIDSALCDGFAFCDAQKKVCRPYKHQFKPCTDSDECYISECVNNICKRLGGGLGTACETSANCNQGLVCSRFVGTSRDIPPEKTCWYDNGSKIGQDCSNNGDCQSPNSGGRKAPICNKGVCVPDLSCVVPGIFCTTNSACCSNNCQLRFDAGAPFPISQCA